eukprot:8148691-Karenia_brevis.AAC.1
MLSDPIPRRSYPLVRSCSVEVAPIGVHIVCMSTISSFHCPSPLGVRWDEHTLLDPLLRHPCPSCPLPG